MNEQTETWAEMNQIIVCKDKRIKEVMEDNLKLYGQIKVIQDASKWFQERVKKLEEERESVGKELILAGEKIQRLTKTMRLMVDYFEFDPTIMGEKEIMIDAESLLKSLEGENE